MPADIAVVDALTYRSVMGLWPTGVAVVSGRNADGEDFGMVIGSFTAVSLEPPLVAFCPQKSSATWQEMRTSGDFCINVLSEPQSALCWKFAKGGVRGRFAGVPFSRTAFGVAELDGCAAWIDVGVEREIEAGDHWIVLCRVKAMRKGDLGLPMSFVKGSLCKSQPVFQPSEDRLADWDASINAHLYHY